MNAWGTASSLLLRSCYMFVHSLLYIAISKNNDRALV
jgi:hypothetical protein